MQLQADISEHPGQATSAGTPATAWVSPTAGVLATEGTPATRTYQKRHYTNFLKFAHISGG